MTKCPKCGSTNISKPTYYNNFLFGTLLECLEYRCECGYFVTKPPLDKQKADGIEERT